MSKKTKGLNKSIASVAGALAAGVAVLGAGMTGASAQTVDALLDKLVDKGILTSEESAKLRNEAAANSSTTALTKQLGMPAWTKSLKLGGDFRIRMDDLWPEAGLNSPERLRFRLRFRYGAVWEATDWATIGFRLASGDARSSGDDANPNSNNQTFTHFFSKKPLYLDNAYVTLQPADAHWVSVTGGKMNKLLYEPNFNSPIVYDPDLTPEGGIVQFNYKFGPHDRFQLIGNLAGFVLDELSGSSGDAYLYDGQAGIRANLAGDPKSPAVQATLLGGYLLTQNLGGIPTSDASGNRGNSTINGGTNYLANFDVVYGRGEVTWKISDHNFLRTPSVLTVGGEYDKNLNGAYESVTPDRSQTTAWAVQATFGQAAKRGAWQIGYQYKYVEADAVLDSLTDDDFGGTDRKGHVVKATYNILDWWALGATAFFTEKISDRPNSGHNQRGIDGERQVRLFVDTMFRF